MKRILLLTTLAALLVGCGSDGGGSALPDTPDKGRPAPGTPTKDVMIPSAKTGP